MPPAVALLNYKRRQKLSRIFPNLGLIVDFLCRHISGISGPTYCDDVNITDKRASQIWDWKLTAERFCSGFAMQEE
jgi:hypothetical protein